MQLIIEIFSETVEIVLKSFYFWTTYADGKQW